MKNTIVILGIELKDNERARLESIGRVVIQPSPDSVEDLLKTTEGADVIYSNGAFLLDSLPRLKDVFVTYPYVELGLFDSEALKQNGVFVANAQGGNRDSIAEWTIYMILGLFRKLGPLVRVEEGSHAQRHQSLAGKDVLIVGRGSLGTRVGELCEAFRMHVRYFERGDDLAASSKDADLIVNALNCNTSSQNLLDESFFMGLKQGAYYVTFARPYTYDIDGLIASIRAGVVAGAGIDCDPEKLGDTTNAFYQKCLSVPEILVTPHIAGLTEQAFDGGGEIAIQNIEAFIAGNPQNVLEKR